jgi:hypothetical protein
MGELEQEQEHLQGTLEDHQIEAGRVYEEVSPSAMTYKDLFCMGFPKKGLRFLWSRKGLVAVLS